MILSGIAQMFQMYAYKELFYDVQIFASDKHKGALALVPLYGTNILGSSVDVQSLTRGYFTQIELNGARTSVRVSLPWLSPARQLNVFNGKKGGIGNQGTFAIVVVKPLSAPATAAKEVEFVVRKSCPSMKFFNNNVNNCSATVSGREVQAGFPII